jgi:hypothetical protein|tara:strand:+ start:11515 stop:11832 length:318 start_codon:yes stop_codon:yes gene_type:complete
LKISRIEKNKRNRARYKSRIRIYQRDCEYEFCQSPFETTYKTKKYCSSACGTFNRSLRKKLRQEGAAIETPQANYQVDPNAKFNEEWLLKPLSKNPDPLVVTYRS